jgi:peptidoglycan/xylan/chitin deacetylase (PgdA/CDA1 family)
MESKYKGVQVFALPIVAFLLSLLWYSWRKKRLLQREMTDLQADDRLLYASNTHLPQIALTFDDGPHPCYTPQVLAILQKYGVKATFFCVGQSVAAYPDIVKEAYAAGHVIANHSWSHPNMALFSRSRIRSELTRTSEVIEQAIGVRPIFFRPPYGAFSAQVLKQADGLGLTTVIWNIRATDWSKPGVDVIAKRILKRSVHGGIILLHDSGGDRSQTVAALPDIIVGLQQRGFTFVTLEQMMMHLDAALPPAKGEKDSPWKDLFMQLLMSSKRRVGRVLNEGRRDASNERRDKILV